MARTAKPPTIVPGMQAGLYSRIWWSRPRRWTPTHWRPSRAH